VEWIPQYVYLPLKSEYDGLFSLEMAPHTRGVLEAWSNETVHTITACWATRLAKTSTGLALLIYMAANLPARMACGGPDEETIVRVFDDQLMPMIERTKATRILLPLHIAGSRRSSISADHEFDGPLVVPILRSPDIPPAASC